MMIDMEVKRMTAAEFMKEYQQRKRKQNNGASEDNGFSKILEDEIKKESSQPTKA